MDHLRMIVRGLERQIDHMYREMDIRAAIVEHDRSDINGLRHRLRIIEHMISVILERIHVLEAGSRTFKTLEVLAPFLLIGLAIVYRVPLESIVGVLGAIK